MKRWLLLLLTASAWAQPKEKLLVRFQVTPVAEVYNVGDAVRGGALGLSDKAVPVDVTGYPADRLLHFEFRREGYASEQADFKVGDLRNGFQVRRQFHLKALSLAPVLWDLRWVLGGLALVALSLGTQFQRLRAKAQRAELLDSQIIRGGERPDPWLGQVLGPYRLVEVLGRGGMATVYKGIPQQTLDEKEAVAVKVMKPELTSDEYRRRFLREYKVSRDLSHPNIVRVVDAGGLDEVLYLAMELVEGESLDRLIPPNGLSVEQAVGYLEPILAGLAYAHSKGVVHRDLKPRNVMVGKRVQLMDFGLARSAEVSRITETGTLMGTPAYMAPEQGAAQATVDARTDQYALGVMFYELLTGRRPFDGDSPLAVLMAHMKEPPPPPRRWRADLPVGLEVVILRMLAKDPEHRYPNLSAVQEAIANHARLDEETMEF